MSEAIKFPRDTTFRKRYFEPDSFSHPAKLDAQLLIYLVERYTKVGDWIFDPMAGSGTLLLACQLGRNVVLNELEDKYIKMCEDNWLKVQQHPQLGYPMGQVVIMKGDARQLTSMQSDAVMFSPPYAESGFGKSNTYSGNVVNRNQQVVSRNRPGNIAKGQKARQQKYADQTEGNIGNLKYGDMSAIITSPPYEAQGFKCDENPANVIRREEERRKLFPMRPKTFAGRYSGDYNNIGNLKGQNYLSAMLLVYEQCWNVLRPDGLLILIVKPFIRNKQVIHLEQDTRSLCEKIGFTFVEELHRILPAQSFWRVLYRRKYPDAPVLDREYVLTFRKEKI